MSILMRAVGVSGAAPGAIEDLGATR